MGTPPGYDIVAQAASGLLMHRLWCEIGANPCPSHCAEPSGSWSIASATALAMGLSAQAVETMWAEIARANGMVSLEALRQAATKYDWSEFVAE